MTPVTFRIDPIGTAGAAEISGLDCSRPFAADELARVKAAFLAYPILAFRDQSLTPAQQARFSAQFGTLINEENREHCHPEDPNVMIISNEIRPDGTAVGVVDAGDYFHADSSHKVEPVHITCLHAIRNPSTGGQTRRDSTASSDRSGRRISSDGSSRSPACRASRCACARPTTTAAIPRTRSSARTTSAMSAGRT